MVADKGETLQLKILAMRMFYAIKCFEKISHESTNIITSVDNQVIILRTKSFKPHNLHVEEN